MKGYPVHSAGPGEIEVEKNRKNLEEGYLFVDRFPPRVGDQIFVFRSNLKEATDSVVGEEVKWGDKKTYIPTYKFHRTSRLQVEKAFLP